MEKTLYIDKYVIEILDIEKKLQIYEYIQRTGEVGVCIAERDTGPLLHFLMSPA